MAHGPWPMCKGGCNDSNRQRIPHTSFGKYLEPPGVLSVKYGYLMISGRSYLTAESFFSHLSHVQYSMFLSHVSIVDCR